MSTKPAHHEESSQGEHGEEPEPGPPWFNFVLAASIAALFATGVYSAAHAPEEAMGGEHAGPAEARYMREEAAKLAKEAHWAESLEKLTEAKKIDPHGDQEEAVQELRRLDEQKMRSAPVHGPEAKPKGHSEEAPNEAPHEQGPHEGK